MRLKYLSFLSLAVVIFFSIGCSTRTKYYIKLQLEGNEASCGGVEIIFSSYDYNAVLDSLAKFNNPGPRPDSTELMAIVAKYQIALGKQTMIADSVNNLREDLENLDINSSEYRKRYPLFFQAEKEEKILTDEQQKIYQQYLEVKNRYQVKVNEWEKTAYKGFSDFKDKIPSDLKTKIETTDKHCLVRKLVLPYGRWWLYAETRRPGKTTEKLIWSFEIPLGETDSTMIILSEENAKTMREML